MTPLQAFVAAELSEPVDARVRAMAAAIAHKHPGSVGVLFYGSCLRDATLSGMLDFYLIVEDYGRAYDRRWLATANRLLPPNVFPFAAGGLSAKYAVLSLADLRRETSVSARDASTYARLAQPCRLVWQAEAGALAIVALALAGAIETLLRFARPRARRPDDALDVWRTAFADTYRAELRAERAGRPVDLVEANRDRFVRCFDLVRPELVAMVDDTARRVAAEGQRANERRGKRRQVAKLAKASLTYAGGVDYLAWKIERHSGHPVAIKPWQRRHPLLAAATLLPRLLRSGAVG